MAHQIRACCLTGHIATGTPKGEMTVLGGLNTYVATPSADKAQEGCAIVMLAGMMLHIKITSCSRTTLMACW